MKPDSEYIDSNSFKGRMEETILTISISQNGKLFTGIWLGYGSFLPWRDGKQNIQIEGY